MRKFKCKTVEEIVESLDAQQREIVAKLRSLVKKTCPEIVEKVSGATSRTFWATRI